MNVQETQPINKTLHEELFGQQRRIRADGEPLHVDAHDLADLRASGITDETIKLNRIYTEDKSDIITGMANLKQVQPWAISPVLVFPYHDADGRPIDYCMLKPHDPDMTEDGRVKKYEAPRHEGNQPYFPRSTDGRLRDQEYPLFHCEGIKKALAAHQDGVAVISYNGCYGWNVTDTKDLLPDVRPLVPGRVHYIIFDYDLKPETQAAVMRAARELAYALYRLRAVKVYIIRLPAGPGNTKQGLDDYLVRSGERASDALAILSQEAQLVTPEVHEAPNDPHRLARLYKGRMYTDGVCRLVYWRDQYHRWEHSAYRTLQQSEVHAEVVAAIKEEFNRLNMEQLPTYYGALGKAKDDKADGKANKADDKQGKPTVMQVTRPLTANVLSALSSMTLLASSVRQPCWRVTSEYPAHEIVACRI
jgi:putative DNA primase/helicase